MKSKAIRKAIIVSLCVLLMTPVLGGTTLSEVSPGFTEVKVNSGAARRADQINPAIDGNRIVWQDNRNGGWNIYMKDLTSGAESRISSGTQQYYPAISGDKVVWSQWKEGYYGGYVSNIHMKNLTSGEVTKLSESAATQQYPAISGNNVVWHDNRNGNDNVFLYNLSGGTETQITPSADHQRYPAVSEDMVVWADWRNTSLDIYSYEISTGTEDRVSLSLADQNYPAISGDNVVWQDSRNGNSIYLHDLATSTERRISTRSQQYNPAISGNIVVWQEYRSGNWDIYMYNISTGTEKAVTTDSADQLNPAVSGNRIVYQSNENGNWDIVMYDVATGARAQVNSNVSFIPADQTNPAVDGCRIAWEDNRDGYPHIYMKDTVTGIERRLSASAATQQYPAISGDKVAWQDARDGGSIYMYDLSTSLEKRIDGVTRQYVPPINPDIDGNKVVWQDYRDGNSNIYLYDLSTLSERRISGVTYPYWSVANTKPAISGNKVVWQKNGYWWYSYYPSTSIVLYDLISGVESSVVSEYSYYYERYRNPAISGNNVVWEDYRNYNPDIYMYDILTRMESRLTANEYYQTNPAVSGGKIVWADKRWYPLHSGIFAYDISNGIDTRLTTSQYPQENPDISGDTVVWQDSRRGDWDIYMVSLSNHAPTADSIVPSSGKTLPGVECTFTTAFSDLDGWKDVQYVSFLTYTGISGAGVKVRYNQNSNKLYLRNDTNTAWLGGYAPGTTNPDGSDKFIENGYAKLNVTDTTISGSGNALAVSWKLTFKEVYSGKQYNTYLYVKDDKGAASGWVKKGTYTVNRSPSVGTITPSSGSGPAETPQTFATTHLDPDGWELIREAKLRFKDQVIGAIPAIPIEVYYSQNTNKLYMKDNTGTSWLGGYAPGTTNPDGSDKFIENSYGKLNVTDTSVSGSGTTLTVNWVVTPKATISGRNYNTYLYTKDDALATAGWTKKGTWGVL